MTKTNLSDAPSAIYRVQIGNIAARMRKLVAHTILHPLRDMTAFNKTEDNFKDAKDEALLCCSVMDNAPIKNEDGANNATAAIMQEMVHLRNDASSQINTSEMRDALDIIYRTYQISIKNNATLDSDFQRLIECVAVSKASATQRCEKIMNHVLAEISEGNNDNDRMADESPSCGNKNTITCEHLELRQALKDFQTAYLL
jgi:hypothetical protein